MPEDLTQLNAHLPTEFVEKADEFRRLHGWSRRDLVATAITTLARVMEAHETFASQYDDDQAETYMRLAAEMPSGFVEVPKDGVKMGRAGDLPVVRVDNWFVFPDPKTGALLAEEQGGQGRIGRIVDGEIKPLKLPSAAEAVLN